MQTILGANGAIARELSKHLAGLTDKVRQVSRNPAPVNATDEVMRADLLNAEEVRKAVEGSEVTYLVAGLKYDHRVWQDEWPRIMRHVIDACKSAGSKLVFFDNVYAYGLVRGVMTEETPYNPCSRKGEVRARIATDLMDEVKAGNLQAMIVRGADFYGPQVPLSLIYSTVVEPLLKGNKPQWIGNPKAVHTFTYTPDAGHAVAVLGNTPSAYNQVWHALSSHERITGEDLVRMACEAVGRPYGLQRVPKLGVRVLGLFVPVLKEFVEMMYQFEEDYFFDSSKFQKAFNLQPTSYRDGISQVMKAGLAVK
ncbi:MAG: NAD-dependent epimerase/dehydratase family protein [Cyclobacteriaceae bacterium]|nr:NAD-dependent epimerase/dehydratase family protein [Cyclobacteriaceae bacterium]